MWFERKYLQSARRVFFILLDHGLELPAHGRPGQSGWSVGVIEAGVEIVVAGVVVVIGQWVGLRVQFAVDGGLQIFDPLQGQLKVIFGRDGFGFGELQLLLQFVLLRRRIDFFLIQIGQILFGVSQLPL